MQTTLTVWILCGFLFLRFLWFVFIHYPQEKKVRTKLIPAKMESQKICSTVEMIHKKIK